MLLAYARKARTVFGGYNQSYTRNMKVAISLPDRLFQDAETVAKTRGVSRSQLYATALADFLNQNKPREVTERLNVIYGQKPAKVDRILNQMQLRALPDEEW